MENTTNIKCPKCGTLIDVQSVLSHQLEDKIKQEHQLEFSKENRELNKQKEQFEKEKKNTKELFKEELDKKVAETLKLEKDKIKIKINEDHKEQFEDMQKELAEKSEQVGELNRSKAEIEKLKREKSEVKEIAEVEAQKNLTKTLSLEKNKIKKSEEEKSEFKMRELQTQLDQQKKLTKEMIRKHEQGSVQLQGEAQELGIEGWLEKKFPSDTIQEIKKGAKGGDCIQIVNNGLELNCGIIYYESKRAAKFSHSWIEKFKTDVRSKKANIGVLVTQVMPSDMDRMGMKNGIWICTYDEFKGLCAVLRESLIEINTVIGNQEGKGDKVNLLYNFLTSNEFKMQIEAIVEGFTEMQSGLDTEKRAMQRIWKQREKQIEKVVDNTVNMYGSIKGIGGNSIQKIKRLELGHDSKSNK